MERIDYLYKSYLTMCSCIFILSKQFKNLAFPIRNNFNYDVLAEYNNKIYKIKVISTQSKQKNGKYLANIRKSGGYTDKKNNKLPFDPELCDYLFVQTPISQYLIPSLKIISKRSITLDQFEEFKIN